MKIKIFLAALLAVAAVCLRAQSASQMRISFSGYTERSETLVNYPALVKFADGVGGSSFSFSANPFVDADGYDLRFYDAGGAMLDYEIDTWDTGAECAVWVKVPEIKPDGSSLIYATWGDINDAAQLDCTTNGAVWADGFLVVQHYNEADGLNVFNATASVRTGTIRNVASDARAPGVVGRSVDLSGSGINCGIVIPSLTTGSEWTAGAWFQGLKPNAVWRTLLRGAGQHHVIVEQGGNRLGAYVGGNFRPSDAGTLLPDNPPVWRHVLAVGSGSTTTFYIDGEPAGVSGYNANDTITHIGFWDNGQQFANFLDEFRVAARVRSADWAWADYMSQSGAPAFTKYADPIPAELPFAVTAGAMSPAPGSVDFSGLLVFHSGSAPTIPLSGMELWWAYAGAAGGYGADTNAWLAAGGGSVAAAFDVGDPDAIRASASGLTLNTNGFYRFRLVYNGGAEVWSDTGRFSVPGYTPVVHVLPATNIEGESATANGRLEESGASFQTADIWFYWGRADEGDDPTLWSGAPSSPVAAPIGDFDFAISGINWGVEYRYCFLASNAIAHAWSAVETFETPYYPAPVIETVTFVFSPTLTNAHITVTEPGVSAQLVFMWDETDMGDTPSAWANVVTIAAPDAGVTTIPLPDLEKGDVRAWRAVLSATGHPDVLLSGTFNVFYTYVWNGRTGYWNDPAMWDLNMVPNAAGDVVITKCTGEGTHYIRLDGMGEITIGTLSAQPGYLANTIFTAADDSMFVMDNLGAPAVIHGGIQLWTGVTISVPVRLTAETRVTVGGSSSNVFIFDGELSGPGPIVLVSGNTAVSAPAGETRVITMPIVSQAGILSRRSGTGNVVIQGGVHPIVFPGGWNDIDMWVTGGGALTLSDTIVTNIHNVGRDRLFVGANNSLIVSNNASLVWQYNRGDNGSGYSANYNTIRVTGAGSSIFVPRMLMNASFCNFLVDDGALARLHHDYFDCSGNTNIINVAGAGSTFNLNAKTLRIRGTGNRLTAESGGVITNGVITINEGSGNSLELQGGQVFCTGLTFGAGNALAPVVGPDGILPAVVSSAVTFPAGSKITPVRADKNTTGRFEILKAPAINTPPLDDPDFFVPALGDVMSWKLRITDEDDGKTLWLSCQHRESMILIK